MIELFEEYDKNVSIIAEASDETVEYIIEKYGILTSEYEYAIICM